MSLTAAADPFIALILPPAMRVGTPIRSGAPVAPGLLKGIGKIQAKFTSWDDSLSNVAVAVAIVYAFASESAVQELEVLVAALWPGTLVKTNRLDARCPVRLLQANEPTVIRVPTYEQSE